MLQQLAQLLPPVVGSKWEDREREGGDKLSQRYARVTSTHPLMAPKLFHGDVPSTPIHRPTTP